MVQYSTTNDVSRLATSVAPSRTPRQKPDQKNRAPTLKLTEQDKWMGDVWLEKTKPTGETVASNTPKHNSDMNLLIHLLNSRHLTDYTLPQPVV